MSFLIPEKHYLPTIHFGEKVAHFTVRSRKSPAVLATSSDKVILNRKQFHARSKSVGDPVTNLLRLENPSSKEQLQAAEERMSMRTFITKRVPSLSTPYRPCWWLPTGHVQTAYCVVADFETVDTVVYKR